LTFVKHTEIHSGAGAERRRLRRAIPLLASGLFFAAGCFTASGKLPADKTLPEGQAKADGVQQTSWNEYVFHDTFGLTPPPPLPTPPPETLVLRGDSLVADPTAVQTTNPQLIGARDYFRRAEYVQAEALYKRVADNKKNPLPEITEARYYEAESLRLQGHYPKAADIYVDLLNKFPQNPYREQAVQHMFDIANYWLDDTRADMRAARQGKSWFAVPSWFNFSSTKPLIDEQGRALEKLEQVRFNDMNGPLADKALFLCGTVKFYNEDYRDADHFFSQIYEKHPNSPLAPKAVELAIIAKHLSTGGSDYDGRKTAEARKLVHAALDNYPELANDPDKRKYLVGQLANINYQQAEKEFKIGEFYEHTGHPAPAYFYYEMVRRRYPNTKYGELAAQRSAEVKLKMDKDQGGPPITPSASAAAPPRPLPATINP
jgi:outer membrane protein assembly factor BamD (BamD/ComL family)